MSKQKTNIRFGQYQATLETGEIGRQADSCVLIEAEGTAVLSAITARKQALAHASFLPLTVDYQEKHYAAGKFPGGYFRREGRPSEKEVLTSRLIDRCLRPLFPDFFYHEVQVLANVVSFNPQIESDLLAMLSSFVGISLSGVPFNGPISAARVGYIDGSLVINPDNQQRENSKLDLILAGSRNGIIMVESEAKELSEDLMLEALASGHQAITDTLDDIQEFITKAQRPSWEWQPPEISTEKKNKLVELTTSNFSQAYQITDKQERSTALAQIKENCLTTLIDEDTDALQVNLLNSYLKKVEADYVRGEIIAGKPRIDGRSTSDIRDITIRLGVLPRTHGSALFTRGETQALVITTLGSGRDEQRIDGLYGEQFDKFLFHYNMPPFATGETGRGGNPKRREIGHGRLAKRGILPVLPNMNEYGYCMRVVSEITESNGSSSMASVCGACLSLMDAGVPVSAHVAGIAMGLIKEEDKFSVLSDILGDEDHLGDMDFKVAGSRQGITALQMDIKIDSITKEIFVAALEQAKHGRLHIIEKMEEAIAKPREDISAYAPKIIKINIPTDRIRDVIGKGGVVIKSIIEETSCSIDINDSGEITIASVNNASAQMAIDRIKTITDPLNVGDIHTGKVEKIIENVGAVVSIAPGKDGLVHISQISQERVENINDYLSVGQTVNVRVMQVDSGKVRLSIKKAQE